MKRSLFKLLIIYSSSVPFVQAQQKSLHDQKIMHNRRAQLMIIQAQLEPDERKQLLMYQKLDTLPCGPKVRKKINKAKNFSKKVMHCKREWHFGKKLSHTILLKKLTP